jgi:NADPH-dependent ferric siderophore reductase
MTIHTNFTYTSNAKLPITALANLMSVLQVEAKEHGLAADVTQSGVTISLPYGIFGVQRSGNDAQVFVNSTKPDWLFMLKDSIVEHLAETEPELARDLRWSNDDQSGQCPPNFNLAKTLSVTPVGAHFLRVRVTADDLSRFTPESLHFRVVLPRAGDENPIWPTVGPNGQTVWPKGDQALHRPVYTIRHIDVVAGWLEFDVFIHDGGRVTEWAQNLQPGHVIGLAGPGGGGVPTQSDIFLTGDETAFPAIARIMTAPNRPKTGDVILFSNAKDYDFDVPDGYTLHWMSPSTGSHAFISRLKASPRSDDSFVWFGGEKSIAQKLRSYFHDDCGVLKEASYISAYWRRAS